MASPRFAVLAAACALVASGAAAQTPDTLTPVQIAVACAPPPVLATVPAEASRVIGSQDPVKRSLFGTPEVLVIGGGMNHGLSLGQEYFIRRVVKGAETYRDNLPHQVHTIGWVRVVAVNEATFAVDLPEARGAMRRGLGLTFQPQVLLLVGPGAALPPGPRRPDSLTHRQT